MKLKSLVVSLLVNMTKYDKNGIRRGAQCQHPFIARQTNHYNKICLRFLGFVGNFMRHFSKRLKISKNLIFLKS